MSEQPTTTVMIVEDDTFLQNLYTAHLHADGYEAMLAGDGESALQQMEASMPDVVLLDLVLPGISGYEVIARMKETSALADIPVIMFSNRGEPEDVERGMSMGAADYLVKSKTTPREVLTKVAQVLGGAVRRRTPLRVEIRQGELDAGQVAEAAGLPDLRCTTCGRRLVLELDPTDDGPGSFHAAFVCTECAD